MTPLGLLPDKFSILSASVKAGLALLETWDLSRVRSRVVARLSLDPKLVSLAEFEYRRFISLPALQPCKLYGMPDSIVDEWWHDHLIHSRDYSGLCLQLTGNYIHHEPAEPNNDSECHDFALNNTYHDLKYYYGQIREEIWPPLNAVTCKTCAVCKTG